MVGEIGDEIRSLKEELLRHPGVTGMTISENLPTYTGSGTYGFSWEGKEAEDRLFLNINKVDPDYIPTFGIQFAEGRNFDPDRPSDSVNFILNETAIHRMHLEDPIGKQFTLWGMQDAQSLCPVCITLRFPVLPGSVRFILFHGGEKNKGNWYPEGYGCHIPPNYHPVFLGCHEMGTDLKPDRLAPGLALNQSLA